MPSIPRNHGWQRREDAWKLPSQQGWEELWDCFPSSVWSSCHLHLAASGPNIEDFSHFCLDSASGEIEEKEREGGGERQRQGERRRNRKELETPGESWLLPVN